MREVFRLFATAEYSLPKLRAAMHAKGFTSPYAAKSGAPVSVSKLAELLANTFYAGVVEWGGVRYPGQHKALIPESLFDRVQDELRARDVARLRQLNEAVLEAVYMKDRKIAGRTSPRSSRLASLARVRIRR